MTHFGEFNLNNKPIVLNRLFNEDYDFNEVGLFAIFDGIPDKKGRQQAAELAFEVLDFCWDDKIMYLDGEEAIRYYIEDAIYEIDKALKSYRGNAFKTKLSMSLVLFFKDHFYLYQYGKTVVLKTNKRDGIENLTQDYANLFGDEEINFYLGEGDFYLKPEYYEFSSQDTLLLMSADLKNLITQYDCSDIFTKGMKGWGNDFVGRINENSQINNGAFTIVGA